MVISKFRTDDGNHSGILIKRLLSISKHGAAAREKARLIAEKLREMKLLFRCKETDR